MTYLELINDVLIRLRETTVSTNAETTYYRRATLQSLLSLQAIDDDGNSVKAATKPSLTDDRFKEALKSIESGKYTAEKLKSEFLLTNQQMQAL